MTKTDDYHPRKLFESADPVYSTLDSSKLCDFRSARVSVDDLVKTLAKRQVREVRVSAGVFGSVLQDKLRVVRSLTDEFFVKSCARVSGEYEGLPVEVSLSVWRAPVRYEAYDFSLHTVGLWLPDDKVLVLY